MTECTSVENKTKRRSVIQEKIGGGGWGGGGCLSLNDLAPQKKKESGTRELKEAKKDGLRKTNTSHCGAEMLL